MVKLRDIGFIVVAVLLIIFLTPSFVVADWPGNSSNSTDSTDVKIWGYINAEAELTALLDDNYMDINKTNFDVEPFTIALGTNNDTYHRNMMSIGAGAYNSNNATNEHDSPSLNFSGMDSVIVDSLYWSIYCSSDSFQLDSIRPVFTHFMDMDSISVIVKMIDCGGFKVRNGERKMLKVAVDHTMPGPFYITTIGLFLFNWDLGSAANDWINYETFLIGKIYRSN